MIIIEGADHVGKTTAALKLCDILASEGVDPRSMYRHMSRPPDDFDHVKGYFEGVGPYVQDRYHLGSIVYGKLLARGTYPTASRMLLVQRYLRWQGCIVIVMYSTRDWLAKALPRNSKKEMYSTEMILAANDGYRALINESNRGEPYCDDSFDVTDGFPSEEVLRGWANAWRARWIS